MLLYPPNQNEIQNSLDHLHSKMHLIHTDIKPENILLVDNNTDEEDVRIKIIDMGSAVFGRAHDDDDNGSSGDSGGLKTSIVNTRQYRCSGDSTQNGMELSI